MAMSMNFAMAGQSVTPLAVGVVDDAIHNICVKSESLGAHLCCILVTYVMRLQMELGHECLALRIQSTKCPDQAALRFPACV